MSMERKKPEWRRLDNTAKIFPVIANENLSNVFRISVTLKEEVDGKLLQQALEELLPHVRDFRVKLRRGMFWYYFEDNKKIPQVQKESTYPCRYIDPHGNKKFLFRVTYYQKRINFEVFHALTDGLGAVNFLKELTCHYLRLKQGEEHIFEDEEEENNHEPEFQAEDSYLKNYKETRKRRYSSKPAYRLTGNYLPLGSGQVLHGYMDVAALKAVCKKKNVTVTKYLAAVLIWSIWQEYLDGKPEEKPVALNIPINLRAFFDSKTVANFFAVTTIGYLFRKEDMDFDTLLQKISRQMDKKIDRKRLEENISYNVSNEKKWYLRITPLVLKWLALNIVFRMKDKAYTMTLSNVGLIQMEPEFQPEIENFHMMIGVSRRQPVKCGVCSFGDKMTVTFTSVFADSRLQKQFFGKIREDGIPVRFEGNELSAADKRNIYPRIRRILILRKGGGEKASRMIKSAGNSGGHALNNLKAYITGKRDLLEELNRRFHV